MNNILANKLSKNYLDNYYQVLSKCSYDKKRLEALKKEINKTEDFNLLLNTFDDSKEILEKEFKDYFGKISIESDKLINQINEFYSLYFADEIVFNVSKIKNSVHKIEQNIELLPKGFELIELNSLDEFISNVEREIDIYKIKHKNDEFLEIDEVKKNIRSYCDRIISLLESFKKQNEIEDYLNVYIDKLKNNFAYYYENVKNKNTSTPSWLKGLIFLSPWLIGFLVFTLYPLIQTLIFSFSEVTLTPDGFVSHLIGFTNYLNLTQDTDFLIAIRNYFASMIVYVPLITVFSLILALLLNSQVKGIGIFRTIFFFPVIITSGPVIKILIEQGVTSMPGLSSLINLDSIKAVLPPFIGSIFNVLTSEFIMILWFSGIQILVFITGLQKIDKSVYEASSIDGANGWEQFWKVTLPALNPVIIINVVFTVVMQSIFALNPIIIKIQNDMNDTSIGKGYQYSSALAFAYFLIIIVTLLVFVFIFKKHGKRNKKAGE